MKVLRSSHQNLYNQHFDMERREKKTYHSAFGYFFIASLIKSTFSQLSRHSCAYRFLATMLTTSISYPHFLAYFLLFHKLTRSIAHSRAPFHSMTPPSTFDAVMMTIFLPLPNAEPRYASTSTIEIVSQCQDVREQIWRKDIPDQKFK